MYKTKLQEMCQKNGWDLPEYDTERKGQDHNPRFQSTVSVNGLKFPSQLLTRSSKQSQNDAAQMAFLHFSGPPPPPLPAPGSSSQGNGFDGSLPVGETLTPIVRKMGQILPENVSNAVAAVVKNDDRFRGSSSRGNVFNSSLSVEETSPQKIQKMGQSLQENVSNGVAVVTKNDDRFKGSSSLGNVFDSSLSVGETLAQKLQKVGQSLQENVSNGVAMVAKNDDQFKGSSSLGNVFDSGLSVGETLAQKIPKIVQSLQENVSNGVAVVAKNDDRFKGFSRETTESSGNLLGGGMLHIPLPKVNQTTQESVCNGATAITKNNDRFRDVQHLCKNHLQMYTQKNNLPLPVYSCDRVGPPHASRFKCKVTINGQTYESPDLFSTIKEAESAAARAALMSLSSNGLKQDESSYKNLLQELAQREGFRLPNYNTSTSGQAHMPVFVSTVEIEGDIFTGHEAKTKKLAELSAAKVAYIAIRSRNSSEIPAHQSPARQSPAHQGREALECSSSGLLSDLTTYFQQNFQPKVLSPSGTAQEGKVSSGSNQHPSEHDDSADSTTSSIINSSIKQLVEQSALCRKGMIVHSRETKVSYPAGSTTSPMSNEDWVVANYNPR